MRGLDGVQGAQGDRRRPHMRSEAQRSTANERFSCRTRNQGVAVWERRFLPADAWPQNVVELGGALKLKYTGVRLPGQIERDVIRQAVEQLTSSAGPKFESLYTHQRPQRLSSDRRSSQLGLGNA